ncbi:hypothetical protein LG293_17265 (plasmid) [Citricoccus nitrophenolicus]
MDQPTNPAHRNRQPRGVSTGGQYAAETRSESALTLHPVPPVPASPEVRSEAAVRALPEAVRRYYPGAVEIIVDVDTTEISAVFAADGTMLCDQYGPVFDFEDTASPDRLAENITPRTFAADAAIGPYQALIRLNDLA